VYSDADIYLLDDPVSALDVDVRRAIFTHVLQGKLKNKTRILSTHAIDFLELSDRVIVMKNGKIEAIVAQDEIKTHPAIAEYISCRD
jgi:ABC-type Na+ transport system ATPase subunit NatA